MDMQNKQQTNKTQLKFLFTPIDGTFFTLLLVNKALSHDEEKDIETKNRQTFREFDQRCSVEAAHIHNMENI